MLRRLFSWRPRFIRDLYDEIGWLRGMCAINSTNLEEMKESIDTLNRRVDQVRDRINVLASLVTVTEAPPEHSDWVLTNTGPKLKLINKATPTDEN
jgi:hypothetical protein